MKCLRCGKELPNDVKFCPDCGYQFAQQLNGNISRQEGDKPQGNYNAGVQTVASQNSINAKQPKKKHGCLIAILICIGAFFCISVLMAIIFSSQKDGSNTNDKKTESSYELYELRDASEDDVCKFFGIEKNEMGNYPSDDCILVYCMEGKVYLLKLSNSDTNYKLCGIKIGDSADEVKEAIKDEFTETVIQEISDTTRIFYSDNKHKGYMLFVDIDSNNKIVGASYGPDDGAEADGEEETDVSQESENKEYDSDEMNYISKCENIPYENLARTPDDYIGKNVMFWGRVNQVILEENDMSQYQILVADSVDSIGTVVYEPPIGKERILEEDYVCVFAEFEGLTTYQTVLGDERTIPLYNAKIIENLSSLPVITDQFEGMLGTYYSEDGGMLDLFVEGNEIYMDVKEDDKTVISTVPFILYSDDELILCENDKNALDAVISVDKTTKQIKIISGLDTSYSNTFTLDADSEATSTEKKGELLEGIYEMTDNDDGALYVRSAEFVYQDGEAFYCHLKATGKDEDGSDILYADFETFLSENNDGTYFGNISGKGSFTIIPYEDEILVESDDMTYFSMIVGKYDYCGKVDVSATEASSEYIFPNSNTAYLTDADVRDFTKDELALARNEIFARHGYIFKDETFSKYFNSRTWYVPKYTGEEFSDSVFNDYEKKNIELIKSYE